MVTHIFVDPVQREVPTMYDTYGFVTKVQALQRCSPGLQSSLAFLWCAHVSQGKAAVRKTIATLQRVSLSCMLEVSGTCTVSVQRQ